MSFNENARIDTSQVSRGSGGGGGGFGGGGLGGGGRGPGRMTVGGGLGGLILVLIMMFIGIDPTTITTGATTNGSTPADNVSGASGSDFSQCRTGADANRSAECRVIATVNSVQAYWSGALPQYGRSWNMTQTVLYKGSTQSACGTASNQVGPFYCPLDEKVYLDASFFDLLESQFGSSGGPLAQEYVVAHEYGHALQDQLGLLSQAQSSPQGAESGSVRIELMADCLAGVWANNASSTTDASGVPFLEPLTDKDISDALSAASAVGDDSIQKKTTGRVNPENWTHGSSAARQKWFTTGYQTGDLNQCDTLSAKNLE